MGSRLDAKSTAVSKAIQGHQFEAEDGEEYEPSKFGGFSDYFRRKKIKLQNLDAQLRAESADNPKIFRGVVAHVNGYTQPSLSDLHQMIVSHGGGFLQYLDGKTQVTHIIASNLTPKKAVEFKRYRIVKPAWIVDSIEAGRLLPWEGYRVVDEGAGQKLLQFQDGRLQSQVNRSSKGYRDQTDASWYTKQIAQESGHVPDGDGMPADLDELDFSSFDAQAEDAQADDDDDDEKQADDDVTPQPSPSPPPQPQSSKRKVTALDEAQESDSKRAKMTAEQHNTELLSDPRIRKSSVLNPDFLEQYYKESRLHHLSTWKADLKSQLQALTSQKSASQKARQKRPANARRYILHVDFDSFFVAVSLKNFPQFKDKPAVVAHGSGAGSEIASCNYAARAFGVKNGMWMKRAQDLCDDIKVLPYDFPAYEAASRLFYDAILSSGGVVQSVSIDEALVDVTAMCLEAGVSQGTGVSEGSIWREQAKADELAQGLRDRVLEQTGCAVSVGIGGNILLAKVALRKAKPAGQHHVKPEEALDFLGPLEAQSLPGVAYSIGGRLEEMGIKFVKDIRDVSKERLVSILGPKTGEKLWNYARGIDRAEVGEQVIRKSVSAEVNWGVRFETQEQAEEFIESLCGELERRLLKEAVRGRSLTMKVMRRSPDAPRDPPKHLGHGKCDTFNKSIALGVATNAKSVLSKEALSILRSFGFSPGELRGLGVQMTKLEPVKAGVKGDSESSQRRLHFGAGLGRPKEPEKPSNVEPSAEPQPDPGSQSDLRRLQFRSQPSSQRPAPAAENDEIQDEPETPRRPKTAKILNVPTTGLDSPSKKPLNTSGTQFILPTQVDPSVLSELPKDIRDRLTNKSKARPEQNQLPFERIAKADEPDDERPIAWTALPSESQLDPGILDALPEDVRAEVLSQYNKSDAKSAGRRGAQAVLPQSPRKARVVQAVKRGAGRGRPRGSSLLSRLKGTGRGGTTTLTQANFVAARSNAGTESNTESDGDGGKNADISAEFLAALPEDIRAEVVENHKREQLRRTGGIEVLRKRRALQKTQRDGGRGERTVRLEARPARPTFTLQKLWKRDELREAVGAWIEEFQQEGPYDEDVEALAKYLRAVVTDEGDMRKAVDVVKWASWTVEQLGSEDASESTAGENWSRAIGKARDAVGDAIRDRGLGDVDLSM